MRRLPLAAGVRWASLFVAGQGRKAEESHQKQKVKMP